MELFPKKIVKNEDFEFKIFEKGKNLRPFSGLTPTKMKMFSTNFNGSKFACRVFCLPIFRRIEGGGVGTDVYQYNC